MLNSFIFRRKTEITKFYYPGIYCATDIPPGLFLHATEQHWQKNRIHTHIPMFLYLFQSLLLPHLPWFKFVYELAGHKMLLQK